MVTNKTNDAVLIIKLSAVQQIENNINARMVANIDNIEIIYLPSSPIPNELPVRLGTPYWPLRFIV